MNQQSYRTIFAALAAVGALLLPATTQAADVKVIGATGVRDVVTLLAPGYERASGNKVVASWNGTVDVLKRLRAGEVVDLVILAAQDIDSLAKEGKILAGSATPILKSDVGVCIKSGAPKPDLSSPDAVKRALLAAKSISYSTGPSGIYMLGLFERMGIADEMKAKAKIAPPGAAVGDIVARGEAELGFHQVSEIIDVAGVDYRGMLPEGIRGTTKFSAAIHTGASQVDAAKALIKSITSPDALPVIRKKGMEPG
jgi:molybdate transport system substrate-binding protein